MEYNFDKVYDRMGSDSIKWEKQLKFGVPSGLTPFWIADTDFATLPQAVEAMRARLEHPIFGYTFTPEKVLEAVQGWYKRRHGVDLPVSAYAAAHGVVTSIWFSIRAFTQEGDGVLVSTPVYDPFFVVIEDQNRKKVDCPLVYEDGAYHIDWEQLDAKLATVKAMIFCNPHNPTGNVWTAQEVERVVQLCKKHDVWLFSDEIHGDVALYGNRCTSAAQFAAEYDKMVVYTAISKTFNMAGLESSCNIIPNPEGRFGQLHARRLADGPQLHGQPRHRRLLHLWRRVGGPDERLPHRKCRICDPYAGREGPRHQGGEAPGHLPDVAGFQRLRHDQQADHRRAGEGVWRGGGRRLRLRQCGRVHPFQYRLPPRDFGERRRSALPLCRF